MRRTASEMINNLEDRIANLEKSSHPIASRNWKDTPLLPKLKSDNPGAYRVVVELYTRTEDFLSKEKEYADYHVGGSTYNFLVELSQDIEDLTMFFDERKIDAGGNETLQRTEKRWRERYWLKGMQIGFREWKKGIWSSEGEEFLSLMMVGGTTALNMWCLLVLSQTKGSTVYQS